MRRRQKFAELSRKANVQSRKESPAEAYERKFGKPPHHRMKPETIQRHVDGDIGNSRA